MITLDTNLYLICDALKISYKKITDKYSGMSIEEILDAETAQGNKAAETFDRDILSNPKKLVEFFGLNNIQNKFAILSNINERDLKELLPLLNPEDLACGLKFFTKNKLLQMIEHLPKKELVKYVFQMFPPEKVIKMMPEKELDKFLQSPDLDKGLVLKHLKSLPPEVLAQMLEAATGKPVEDMNPHSMVNQVGALSPLQYKDALLSIPEEKKREFILRMTKEDPKLFELFSAESYTRIVATKDKPDLIKAAVVIDPEELVKMIGQLPPDLISVVLTQIDPQVFAEVLIKDYKDILNQVVAA